MHAEALSTAEVAVIGGSGLYSLLKDAVSVQVETPYGLPSGPITVAPIGDRNVAFLPRHGEHHEFPPHMVNYRANVWALHSLGVRQILAPCAVGSLRIDVGPGTLVAPDQLVDWTSERHQSFHDTFAGASGTSTPIHASFADPYCPRIRATALRAASEAQWSAIDGGTMVVIDGPRFSTRAESQFFAAQGWLLVNMTGHPEAVLCRELGVCYAPLALVTDLDAGVHEGEGVHVDQVMAEFARNTDRLRAVLLAAVTDLPEDVCASCPQP